MQVLCILVTAVDYRYRFTDKLATNKYTYDCYPAQGDTITVISCPTEYEIYNTDQLAQNPYNLVNSGESDPIHSVKNSLETKKQGRLTFVQNGNEIKTVYKDPNFNAIDPNI